MELGMREREAQELDYLTMHLVMASIHESERKLETAIVEYTEVLEYDPEIFQVYVHRGRLYMRLGEFRRALLDFERAAILEPQIASTYIMCGDAFLAAGDAERAQQEYLKCLAMAPGNPVAAHRLESIGGTYASVA
ncbi:MAG: hypothetical protein CVV33_10425 [Methanomicrobiales archaeon HGW-Methanomicrobiales-4]|nr:MAG: hypothetical protein CVV33_10425 [Methanomicrobiales archaeon HGW-Methanomicrobiales-4]